MKPKPNENWKDFRITPTFIMHAESLIMYALYCF